MATPYIPKWWGDFEIERMGERREDARAQARRVLIDPQLKTIRQAMREIASALTDTSELDQLDITSLRSTAIAMAMGFEVIRDVMETHGE